jgi:hypothetical protein
VEEPRLWDPVVRYHAEADLIGVRRGRLGIAAAGRVRQSRKPARVSLQGNPITRGL